MALFRKQNNQKSAPRREDYADDIAFEAAQMAARIGGAKPVMSAESYQANLEQIRQRIMARKPLNTSAAIAINIAVFGLAIAGVFKATDYGVDHARAQPLLGRAAIAAVPEPTELKSLPLLLAQGEGAGQRGLFDQTEPEAINRIFDPRRLMSHEELTQVMASMGLDEQGQPLPEPVAEPEPEVIDWQPIYTDLINASFHIESVVPGAGAFINGRWYTQGAAVADGQIDGHSVVVELAEAQRHVTVFRVNGMLIQARQAAL
ncbi:hypothetical protein [Sinimarinibacterium sp. NLF-5-8]|uniref:hypothetical protein n=1 Tax=Sinimarinibacterium sp. NLF-5-8 TaxID=2698684 RepID=UPI00137B98B6|nr:hypothetical protein [Sinimarinibacterium sp. NLF-5-8]QHS09136.1 hypothetical protein GT972_02515 [Sinimarinibacterium sp. NLF-5-8]